MKKPLSNILFVQNRFQYHVDSAFTFTGKERDEETGYGYFGARYYDADLLTGWLSMDPMADKYPNMSPYNYCAWNPIKLVDPDGLEYGDYYTKTGKWVGTDNQQDDKMYLCTGKNANGGFDNVQNLSITHSAFRKRAATVYGESSAYKYNTMSEDLEHEMFAIASVLSRNSIAYGSNSSKAREFLKNTPEENNQSPFKVAATAAVLNTLIGGFDYSYGATQWDGMEQALFPMEDNRLSSGKYELHMNTMGWSIKSEHYKKWKENVGAGFKAPQEKAAVAGSNKGQKKLSSTAVYCGTIFWMLTPEKK